MEAIKTYNPSVEQTIPKFFPDIRQRKLAYSFLKKSNVKSNRRFLFKSENNVRGSRTSLYPIGILEEIKANLDNRESSLLRIIPKGWIDLSTIEERYNIEINDIYLLFRLVGLKSEKSYRPEGVSVGRKLFKVEDVEYIISKIDKLRDHFNKEVDHDG